MIDCPISALGPSSYFWVLRILKILHPWSTTSHGFARAAVEGVVEAQGLTNGDCVVSIIVAKPQAA